MHTVHIDRLKLTDFRNHVATTIDVDERHVVIFGENGAGKTNILEAVSFLSPGRGMRRASYEQIGRASSSGAWTVFAKLQGPNDEVSIGTGLQQTAHGVETQRKVHINGAQAKTSDALLEHSRVLWLTPSMDGLFTGPASDRRRFLDRMVLAVDPAHGRRVSDFEKTMRARNKLLSEPSPDAQWLDANEAQLAELGVAVASARHEMVSLLSRSIVENNDPNSPFPDAIVTLSGTLETEIGEISASDLEDEYLDRLKSSRGMDARAGRTLEGPHRSDLVVHHRPKAMAAAQCSTGEQKALLIGLLLAHARLVGEMAGFAPILLLDEIAAHLDEGRRAALYEMISELGCQAWMTGTDRDLFKALDNSANFLKVADGKVTLE
ncbi:MAG: DNA replication/repair protein RecF [Rhizobiaceae bacterium]|nr:DNA replication/repair protein RecF [Rhizobiaceae bacterium]